MKKIAILLLAQLFIYGVSGQTKIQLSLKKAIELANDSSIAAFRAQNLFLASFWDYKNYEASSKPTLSLNTSPFSYDRSITKQFNAVDSSYSYYQQHNLSSAMGLILNQNIALTGGSISVNSSLNRLQNFGSQPFTQFSSSPVWIALSQPLFAYNSFKWEKKIAPLKYEKAKKELISSYENNAYTVVGYFFNLAMAEQNFKLAQTNLANADTLYAIGNKRYTISTITRMDLLNLKLELLNCKDQLTIAGNSLTRAQSLLLSFLSMDKDTPLELILPEEVPDLTVEVFKAIELAKANNPTVLGFQQEELESNSNVESIKKKNQPEVSLNASYGLSRTSDKLPEVYKGLSRQEYINLNLSIPLMDWGLRKGRLNLALKEREAKMASLKQDKIDFEEEIGTQVATFNVQNHLVLSARETSNVANEAYEISKIKFKIGNMDINDMIAQLNRKDSALRNYISTLQGYWSSFYAVRRITLFDFETNQSLSVDFEQKLGL